MDHDVEPSTSEPSTSEPTVADDRAPTAVVEELAPGGDATARAPSTEELARLEGELAELERELAALEAVDGSSV